MKKERKPFSLRTEFIFYSIDCIINGIILMGGFVICFQKSLSWGLGIIAFAGLLQFTTVKKFLMEYKKKSGRVK